MADNTPKTDMNMVCCDAPGTGCTPADNECPVPCCTDCPMPTNKPSTDAPGTGTGMPGQM
jgi:hypothetical protein